jgi:MFS family permease
VLANFWPFLLTVFFCQIPIQASAIFVGDLARAFDVNVTVIGGLRGVGGIAALLIGLLVAPVMDRVPRGWTVCIGMALAALGSGLTLVAEVPALAASFFALGCGLALVAPAIQATGGDLFQTTTAGRAAAMVNAVQSLSGVLAGPVLIGPALIAGWQGAYVGMVLGALLTVAFVAPRLSWQRPTGVRRIAYRELFSVVARAPGAVPVLRPSTARNCVTQGWTAFFAAMLTERFQADVPTIGAFYFLGAGGVFMGNVVTARLLHAPVDGPAPWWRSADRLLLVSTVGMVLTAPLTWISPSLLSALVTMVLFAATVGVSISALVSVPVPGRRRHPGRHGGVRPGLNPQPVTPSRS